MNTWLDSLSLTQLPGKSNSQNARHIVQLMICIDEGCAKKKKKTNNPLKNSDKMYHKSCASSHP